MLSVYQIMKDLTTWAWGHKRTAGELLLAAALAFLWIKDQRAKAAQHKQELEAQGLAANLKEQITVRDGQIEVLKRENGKVTYKNVYVPPEGYVVVKETDQAVLQSKLNELGQKLKDALAKGDSPAAAELRKEIDKVTQTQYDVHDHGWVLRPGGRADYSNNNGLKLGLDFKWYYWQRFGFVFGGTANGIGPGISYHLDQLPTHPKNLEFYLNYNFLLNTPGHPIAAGLRMDF